MKTTSPSNDGLHTPCDAQRLSRRAIPVGGRRTSPPSTMTGEQPTSGRVRGRSAGGGGGGKGRAIHATSSSWGGVIDWRQLRRPRLVATRHSRTHEEEWCQQGRVLFLAGTRRQYEYSYSTRSLYKMQQHSHPFSYSRVLLCRSVMTHPVSDQVLIPFGCCYYRLGLQKIQLLFPVPKKGSKPTYK